MGCMWKLVAVTAAVCLVWKTEICFGNPVFDAVFDRKSEANIRTRRHVNDNTHHHHEDSHEHDTHHHHDTGHHGHDDHHHDSSHVDHHHDHGTSHSSHHHGSHRDSHEHHDHHHNPHHHHQHGTAHQVDTHHNHHRDHGHHDHHEPISSTSTSGKHHGQHYDAVVKHTDKLGHTHSDVIHHEHAREEDERTATEVQHLSGHHHHHHHHHDHQTGNLNMTDETQDDNSTSSNESLTEIFGRCDVNSNDNGLAINGSIHLRQKCTKKCCCCNMKGNSQPVEMKLNLKTSGSRAATGIVVELLEYGVITPKCDMMGARFGGNTNATTKNISTHVSVIPNEAGEVVTKLEGQGLTLRGKDTIFGRGIKMTTTVSEPDHDLLVNCCVISQAPSDPIWDTN